MLKQIRQFGFPLGLAEPIWLFADDIPLKAHPAYSDAKSGDITAAVELVADLGLDFLHLNREKLPSNACYVAPHAIEASGDNAIPQVLAKAAAMISGGTVDNDIVQTSRVFHTGADPMERIATRPLFEGIVASGTPHFLVDDVTTMGGTLAELSNYILNQGGLVIGVIVLSNAGRSKNLRPNPKKLHQIVARHELKIEEILHIAPSALTANEADYLIGFRTADEIRNRLAKARKETDLRLRSKGIEE
jgi:hypothetical protein